MQHKISTPFPGITTARMYVLACFAITTLHSNLVLGVFWGDNQIPAKATDM